MLSSSRSSILRTLSGLRRSNLAVPLSTYTAGTNVHSDKGRNLTALVAGVLAVGGSSFGLLAFAESESESESKTQTESVTNQKKKSKFLFRDSFRKRVFFNYEKRIRMQSPPEKIFEYFASFHGPDGEIFMSPADLMRAVVPVFPPSESDRVREGFLRGEKHPGELQCAPSNFFMLFDTDNDGLISFAEYIFFVTLLNIPESSFSVAFKMFDLDQSGEIEREEFRKVMSLMQSYSRHATTHSNGRRAGFKVGNVENGGLFSHFFGDDGNGRLTHDTFVQFLRDLHEEIVRLEFAHYDYNSRGTISTKDFALSMVASAEINHVSKLLDRVDELDDNPQLSDARITFEEFKTFAELRSSLQPLTLAIFGYGKVNGLLTKEDFQRAASHVCGITVSNNVVDIIFHVFDTNRDGNLSSEEFLQALRRWDSDVNHPGESGITGLLSCCFKCTRNCFITKMTM